MKNTAEISFLLGSAILVHSLIIAPSVSIAADYPKYEKAFKQSRKLLSKLRQDPKAEIPAFASGKEGQELFIELEECITLALLNNLSIRLSLFPGKKLEQEIRTARSVFDPRFQARIDFQDSTSQATSALQGADVNEEKQIGTELGITKKTQDGTEYALSWTGGRRKTNSSFFLLNPVYSNEVSLEARHSLSKMRGEDLNLANLRALKHQRAAARCQVHATINTVMYEVISAFLKVRQKEEEIAIQEQSLEQVKELVEITQKRMAVGRAVEAQLIKDQAQLAEQREQLIVTRVEREQACDELLQLISPKPSSRPDPERLNLLFESPKTPEISLDFSGLSRSARLKRPEVLSILANMRAQDLALKIARDDVQASFDLVSSVTLQGFEGSFPESQEKVASLDYPVYSIGIQYSFPIGMRSSKSQLRKEELARKEMEVELLELESRIELQVRQSLRSLRSSLERMKAARKTVDFAKRSYTNEKLLYKQGRTTPYQVNEYRISYDEARLRLSQARRDYLLALASIRSAEGTLPDVFAKFGTLDARSLVRGMEEDD